MLARALSPRREKHFTDNQLSLSVQKQRTSPRTQNMTQIRSDGPISLSLQRRPCSMCTCGSPADSSQSCAPPRRGLRRTDKPTQLSACKATAPDLCPGSRAGGHLLQPTGQERRLCPGNLDGFLCTCTGLTPPDDTLGRPWHIRRGAAGAWRACAGQTAFRRLFLRASH